MKIVIAVATANAALRAFMSAKRDLVVPPEAVAKGYLHDVNVRFSVHVFAIDPTSEPATLGEWLERLAATTDGLILLVDEKYRHIAADFEDAYFVVSLLEPHGKIIQNYIRSALAPILRHFSIYLQRFNTFNNQRILLLPLEIFRAADLVILRTLMTHGKMQPGFGQRLDEVISALRQRAKPKTKTRYKSVYLVDDRPLWFRYGQEKHAVVETTTPPHKNKCWHNSVFRFGRSYDSRLHHNVDDGSKISAVHCNLNSCHGQEFKANGQSHLNVFPNGYI